MTRHSSRLQACTYCPRSTGRKPAEGHSEANRDRNLGIPLGEPDDAKKKRKEGFWSLQELTNISTAWTDGFLEACEMLRVEILVGRVCVVETGVDLSAPPDNHFFRRGLSRSQHDPSDTPHAPNRTAEQDFCICSP